MAAQVGRTGAAAREGRRGRGAALQRRHAGLELLLGALLPTFREVSRDLSENIRRISGDPGEGSRKIPAACN